ncbi:MAG: hypothetical protein KKB62_03705 [Nanoarchaeota archaeon]|nr:hypothetical protein [Nanoarchaeota archaeon]
MNKKAQFYFLAVVVIASIYIAFATIVNGINYNPLSRLEYQSEGIKIEISNLLDYLSYGGFSDAESKTIITNFSNSYLNEIGEDKDILFAFGKYPSMTLVGKRLEATEVSVDVGNGKESVNELGEFEKDYVMSSSNLALYLDNTLYNFTFYPGQNIYYLIKHSYNNQIFIVKG